MQKAMQEHFRRKTMSAQAGARRARSLQRKPLPSPEDMHRPQTTAAGRVQQGDTAQKQVEQALAGSQSSHLKESSLSSRSEESDENCKLFLLKGKALSMVDMDTIPEEQSSQIKSDSSITEMKSGHDQLNHSLRQTQFKRNDAEEQGSLNDKKKSESNTELSDLELNQPPMSATVTLRTQLSQSEQGARCQKPTTKRYN